jgi:hypothetical protein
MGERYIIFGDYGLESEAELFWSYVKGAAIRWAEKHCDLETFGSVEVVTFRPSGEVVTHWRKKRDD